MKALAGGETKGHYHDGQEKILISYDGSNCAGCGAGRLQPAGLPSEAEAVVITGDEQWPLVITSYWRMPTSPASTRPVSDETRDLARRAGECLRELFP